MAKTRDFSFIRGDTARIRIQLRNTEVLPDEIWLSVKRTVNATDYILQKSLTDGIEAGEDMTYDIRIAPEDTQELQIGVYYYDVELRYGEDIYTPVVGRLGLGADITRRPVGGG